MRQDKGFTLILIFIVIVLVGIAGIVYIEFNKRQIRVSPVDTASPTPFNTVTPSPGKNTLIPADNKTPAAGFCDSVAGPGALVILNPDVPEPRCTIITPSQTISLKNNTVKTVVLDYHQFKAQIAPNSVYTIPGTAGSYFLPGVHIITTSLYAGSGPEIWLK